MFSRVLVAVDGSTFSEHALPYAAAAARATGAELTVALVHVRQTPATPEMVLIYELNEWEREHRQREADYLHELAEAVERDHGVAARPQLLEGEIVPALRRYIEKEAVDLVVMTTHGRAGLERAWLGSVADALVRHVHVPVLLIRPSDEEPAQRAEQPEFEHVLIALDGGEAAEGSIAPALAIGGPTARVTLLRVVSPPAAVASPYLPHAAVLTHEAIEQRQKGAAAYVEAQADRLGAEGVSAAAVVVVDYHEAHAILNHAESEDADLIALGTHGRNPVTRLLLGSVSDKVVRAAQVPVLVCPPLT